MNTSETAADFSYLDSFALRDRYVSGPQRNRITFYIDGIRCGSCVRRLEGMVGQVPGLLDLRVNLPKKVAYAEVDPQQATFASIAAAVRRLGFEPVPLAAESEGETLARQDDRRQVIRLAVAGACAGNIMSFAFATYFGATEEWAPLFGWLSFLLYIPVVTYVAWPFYVGAYTSIRQRRLSIDLPMAVASLTGFVYSSVQLANGGTDIYFDSLSGFLFLILASRFFQRRLQRNFLESHDVLETMKLQRVRVMQGSTWSWQNLDQIKAGTEILVLRDETVPADGDLLETAAHLSLAYLSGENAPRKFSPGSLVPAGARLVADEARIRITRTLDETAFGRLLAETRRYSLTALRPVQISDRWAQYLLAIVFTAAVLFLALYWPVSPAEAIRRALALIILACPCAMAFGTPLAMAAAIRKAQRRGILLRDGGVFERVTEVETIFFDKTGTLTDTDLSLIEDYERVPRVRRQIVLSLEQRSHHPIAFAFRKAFPETQLLKVHEFNEIAGEGVEGYVGGSFYRLVKPKISLGRAAACILECNGLEVQRFTFASKIKPDAKQTLEQLRERGLALRLISGDNTAAALATGRELGFRDEEIFGAMRPEDKQALLMKSPKSMMIGDGINDAPALMAAHVAVAATGGTDGALKTSQVLLTAPSVRAIGDLFQISHSAFRLIRRNLLISATYNSVAGVCALLGFVNPYLAAVLMPLSSGLLLVTTWLGGRR